MAYGSEVEKLERRWMENPMGVSFAPLAEAYRRAGDPARALEVLAIGLANHPAYVPALIVQARCQVDAGAVTEAEESFRAVLATDAHNIIALKGLADLCELGDRPEVAAGFLERLLEADPTHDDARTQLDRVTSLSRERAQQAAAPAAADTVATEAVHEEPAGFEPTHAADEPPEEPSPTLLEAELEFSAAGIELDLPAENLAPLGLEDAPEPAEPVAEFTTTDAAATDGGIAPPDSSGLEPVGEGYLTESASAEPAPGSADFLEVEKDVGPFEAFEASEWVGASVARTDGPDVPFEEGIAPDWLEASAADDELDVEHAEEPSPAEASVEAGAPGPDAAEPTEPAQPDEALSEVAFAEAIGDSPRSEEARSEAEVRDEEEQAASHSGPEPDRPDDAGVRDEASPVPALQESEQEPDPPRSWDQWARAVVGEEPPRAEVSVEPEPEERAAAFPDEPEEVTGTALAEGDEPVEIVSGAEAEAADEGELEIQPDLVITATMARLFERQGHKTMALAIYAELAGRDPADGELAAAVERLTFELGQRTPPGPVEATPAKPAGGGAILDAAPTRASDDLLSLDAVFGTPAPRAAAAAGTGDDPAGHEPSFDEFFGEVPAAAGRRDDARGADADLEQFNAWLRSLKR